MTQNLTDTQNDPDTIHNAALVIDLFGGIRPMASKMGVPVTTVQGWKKRDVIPGNRRNDVMRAAAAHGIALDGVRMGRGAAPAPAASSASDAAGAAHVSNYDAAGAAPVSVSDAAGAAPVSVSDAAGAASMSDAAIARAAIMDEIRRSQTEAETRAVRKSLLASAALIGVFVVISAVLIAVGKQKFQTHDAKLAAIEEQVQGGGPAVSAGAGLANQFGRTISDLREKTERLQGTVQDLKTQFESGSLMQRLARLEDALAVMTSGNSDLSGVMSKIEMLQNSVQGQDKMQAVVADLQKIVTGLEGRVDGIEPALEAEQQNKDSALSEALEGVSPQELKAAAMLIGLAQFRDTMRRSGPFSEDLAMLQAILGERDPALNAAIERLAPYADSGVLSPDGLSNELRGLAGEIVVSSIKGEDVSVQEKALARFHDVLKIHKDGQPITGNQTQAAVAQAQAQLDQGDIEGAIATLETLQGPARETAQPIIDQATATKMAQEVQSLLTGSVLKHIEKIGKGGIAGGAIPYTTQRPAIPMDLAPNLNMPGQP